MLKMEEPEGGIETKGRVVIIDHIYLKKTAAGYGHGGPKESLRHMCLLEWEAGVGW